MCGPRIEGVNGQLWTAKNGEAIQEKLCFQNQRNAEFFDFLLARIPKKHEFFDAFVDSKQNSYIVQPSENVTRIDWSLHFEKGKDIRETAASRLKECQCRLDSSHPNGFYPISRCMDPFPPFA